MVEFGAKEIFSTVENLVFIRRLKGFQCSSVLLSVSGHNAQEDDRFVAASSVVMVDKVVIIQLRGPMTQNTNERKILN